MSESRPLSIIPGFESVPYKYRLIRYLKAYRKYTNATDVDFLLHQYKPHYEALFQKLKLELGPEPLQEPTAVRLERFYQQRNPAKVAEAPTLLKDFSGKETELFCLLVHKYGPEPEPPTPRSTTSVDSGGILNKDAYRISPSVHSDDTVVNVLPRHTSASTTTTNRVVVERAIIQYFGINFGVYDRGSFEQRARFRDAIAQDVALSVGLQPPQVVVTHIQDPNTDVLIEMRLDARDCALVCRALLDKIHRGDFRVIATRTSYQNDLGGNPSLIVTHAAKILNGESTPGYEFDGVGGGGGSPALEFPGPRGEKKPKVMNASGLVPRASVVQYDPTAAQSWYDWTSSWNNSSTSTIQPMHHKNNERQTPPALPSPIERTTASATSSFFTDMKANQGNLEYSGQ
eukprot:PhF_6_TR11286/c0_g1_i1/m.18213